MAPTPLDARSSWPAQHHDDHSDARRPDGRREPAVGRASDPWGIKQARHRRLRADVSRLLRRRDRPPSQTWRAFLTNHLTSLVSLDFFTVPTLTGRVLFVLVLLSHHRR